jgi:hypothetical protein
VYTGPMPGAKMEILVNNPHFSNPNTSRSSASFERITGTTLIPRQIQLGAKLTF